MLAAYDWRIIIVWECQLESDSLDETVSFIRKQLSENKKSYEEYMADRRKRREEWCEEMKRRKRKAEDLIEQLNR